MSESLIIELDSIDSTNNYAMQLIDADKAQHGLTIVAQSQTAGKGQRGKSWMDKPGESLLMSMIVTPRLLISEQFVFNAGIAVAIANVLQKVNDSWTVHIKWPNDMIINDKKAGGILIENVLRGSRWLYSVIGLGLNIKQAVFPEDLPYATSLKIASGKDYDAMDIREQIQAQVLSMVNTPGTKEARMKRYNDLLYKAGQKQAFTDETGSWEALVLHTNTDGTLSVQLQDGSILSYYHGQAMWVWE